MRSPSPLQMAHLRWPPNFTHVHDPLLMRVPSLSALARTTVLAAGLVMTTASAHAQAGGSDGWTSLFDGKSMAAWRGYQEATLPAGWSVTNGTMGKVAATGDIVSKEKYTNFVLELEWKLATRGNAGIFYRASESEKKIYLTGTEYQLLDDANAPDGKSPLTSAGAAYAIYPAPRGVVKPADQWNSTRIVVDGARVEHWLNGTKLLEYTFWSPDWEAKVKASKFGSVPTYGREKSGHIGIQGDHEGALALRNVRIKVLP